MSLHVVVTVLQLLFLVDVYCLLVQDVMVSSGAASPLVSLYQSLHQLYVPQPGHSPCHSHYFAARDHPQMHA